MAKVRGQDKARVMGCKIINKRADDVAPYSPNTYAATGSSVFQLILIEFFFF